MKIISKNQTPGIESSLQISDNEDLPNESKSKEPMSATNISRNSGSGDQQRADHDFIGIINQALLQSSFNSAGSDQSESSKKSTAVATGAAGLSSKEAGMSTEAYDIITPPGLQSVRPGQEFDEETGKVDWRKIVDHEIGSDGSKTYFYEGETEDEKYGSWDGFTLGPFDSDTNFSAMERVDANGKLMEAHVIYGNNIRAYEETDVREVHIRFNQETQLYDITLVKENGFRYQLSKDKDGRIVHSLKRLDDGPPSDRSADLESLKESIREEATGDRARIEALMKNYDPEAGDADDIAEKIAADPRLLKQVTKEERLQLVRGLFDGHTTEGEENAATKILLSANRDELNSLAKEIGWEELESELDSEDIAKLKSKLAEPPKGSEQAWHKYTQPQGDKYSVLKPPGMGELADGKQISSEEYGVDWRTVDWKDTTSGGRSLTYKGELADGGFLGNDTNFTAHEEYDADGKLRSSSIEYDPPKDMSLKGPADDDDHLNFAGSNEKIKNVKSIKTERNPDGTYTSKITASVDGSYDRTIIIYSNEEGRPFQIDS